jgi:predicted CoA-binding protein
VNVAPAFQNPSDDVIAEILAHPRRIAVVGCSPDPDRDSHRIAQLLLARGHSVVPVNPTAESVLGLPCYPRLRAVPGKVDVVDIFRRSSEVAPIVEEAIEIGARVVWMQLGVIDEEAARRAGQAGLTVVMDRCPAIEYRRLFP